MKPPAHNRGQRPAPRRAQATGRVRIIGGRWRGTRLPVTDAEGLRPTSDRVRETLFNWLLPVLPGARVLDLFAGSGALGLEALSRGAASAVLVERDPGLAAGLRELTTRLDGGDAVAVIQADVLAWLPGQAAAGYDIAFVDPPFAADLWSAVVPALMPALAAGAWLYVESPPDQPVALPPGWYLHREGGTRDVRYALYRHTAPIPPSEAVAAVDTLAPDPAGVGARATESSEP